MSTTHKPNILLIVSDDHAAPAISCYGSEMNRTPNIDRIGDGGMRFNNCFCTNAICTPARGSILTGKYSHKTGIKTLSDTIDHTQEQTVAQMLHGDGYQTAIVGKWHLGHGGVSDPHGFDYWNVFPVQGAHINPEMIEMGERKKFDGYSADIVTDSSLNWLQNRESDQPFFLMTTYKATHDPFFPNPKHLHLYTDEIPEPPTFNDDYENRAAGAAMNTAKVSIMQRKNHLPEPTPEGLEGDDLKRWNYQCYMQNYLRCAHAIDENVGRLLDYLDAEGLAEDTIVIYSADHGFFLGDHGWYDKRFMYEESMRIPLLVRYPREIQAEGVSEQLTLNVDFAPTLLDYAGAAIPDDMQGHSLRTSLNGKTPADWRTSMYYRYWMHLAHFNIPAHYGVRTERYKLIYYYGEALGAGGAIDRSTPPEWELFDLEKDPHEMHNVYEDPAYTGIVAELKAELQRLRDELGDYE